MSRKRKDTFIFRTQWKEAIKDYPPEVRLEVYEAIIEYIDSGTLPKLKPLAGMAFNFIKIEIDSYSERYDETVKKRREAGRKGSASRWGKNDNKNGKCYQELANVTKMADNDSDIDKKEISLSKEKETKKDAKPILPEGYEELGLEDCYREIMSEEIWAQDVLMAAVRKGYKLDQQKLAEYVTEFFGELKCRGETSRSLKGAKEHFSNWLNVKLEKLKQYEKRSTNGRGNYTSKQEANDYALSQFLAMREAREQGVVAEVAKPF